MAIISLKFGFEPPPILDVGVEASSLASDD